MTAAVKQCRCGLAFDATQWAALPLAYRACDGVERQECRQCACGSTICIATCARCGARIPDDADDCPGCQASLVASLPTWSGTL